MGTLQLLLHVLLMVHSVYSACKTTDIVASKYMRSCGIFGWDECTAYKYHTVPICCTGWEVLPDCDKAICHGNANWCPNGGTCVRPDYCECPENFYSPKCDRCASIANCLYDEHRCTTSSDQTCNKCEYQFGGSINAYLPQGNKCEKQCSWRSDSLQCWPGSCSGSTSTCTCMEGFGGEDCMTISKTPASSFCIERVSVDDGDKAVTIDCSQGWNAQTIFINLRPESGLKVLGNLSVLSSQLMKDPPPKHYYIRDFQVGLTSATLDWNLIATGLRGESGSIECGQGLDQDNPKQAAHQCQLDHSININQQHGDVLILQAKVKNGGFLKTYNFNSGAPEGDPTTQYYSESETTQIASLTFDYEAPYHCSVSTDCQNNMLDRGEAFTKEGNINVRWSGWSDDLSGMKQYDLEVYKLEASGDTLTYTPQSLIDKYTIMPHSATEQQIALTQTGVYCTVLHAQDNAGNTRSARRFLMYDNESNVTVRDSHKMWISSAAANTTYQWITTLDEKVTAKWEGHFINNFHHTQGLLNRIFTDGSLFEEGYEESTGQPVETRSLEAIQNNLGIVRFDTALIVTLDVTSSHAQVPPEDKFTMLDNMQTEQMSAAVALQDGDSLRSWVRAYDVLGNAEVDSVLVHVDSSPPIVQEVVLKYDLAQKDMLMLSVDIKSADPHSGVKTLKLNRKSSQSATDNALAEQLTTGLVQQDNCKHPDCYCIPKDEECYNYTHSLEMFTLSNDGLQNDSLALTVINNAMLTTELSIPFVSNISPTTGVLAGGTKITISGSNLPVNLKMQFGEFELTPLESCSVSTCYFESPKGTEDHLDALLPVMFTHQGVLNYSIDIMTTFTYQPNPLVTKLYPLETVMQGGITITVEGRELGEVGDPTLLVHLISKSQDETETKLSFKSPCNKISSEKLTCHTPRLNVSTLLNTLVGIEGDGSSVWTVNEQRLEFSLGVALDGYDGYIDLNDSLPEYAMLGVYVNGPQFTQYSKIEAVKSSDTLRIKGTGLEAGLSKEDYTVYVGEEQCEILDLTADELICKLPAEAMTTEHEHKVLVHPGANLSPEVIGYVTYADASNGSNDPDDKDDEEEEDDKGDSDLNVIYIIVGATIAVGLAVLILTGVLICCCRRCKTEEKV